MRASPRIALVWHQADDEPKARRSRLDGVFRALSARGAAPEAVVYSDEAASAARDSLLHADGVLVWVNPITGGRDRGLLDSVLREVARAGVWVSAHPDVVGVLGTKEVLYRTRTLGWGSDVQMYRDVDALSEALPARLRSGPIVLKRSRGNDGFGVWKVELKENVPHASLASTIRIEHAHDAAMEMSSLSSFVQRFSGYFQEGGRLIAQPYFRRVAEGMVRSYISGRTVVGFAEHLPRGLLPEGNSPEGRAPALFKKVMHGPETFSFRSLRTRLESEWIPGMQRLLGLETEALPAIWDADFFNGDDGPDAWVLCEINASCVSPFPDVAAEPIAETTLDRVSSVQGRSP